MSMKPKVALVKDGFLPSGSENKRGRLSAAAIERCKELAAQGWKIEGYEVSNTKSDKPEAKPEVVKTKVQTGTEIADFVILHEEADHKVIEKQSKKPRSMREVCNNCRVSLVQCHCGSPMIVARDGSRSVAVEIRRVA